MVITMKKIVQDAAVVDVMFVDEKAFMLMTYKRLIVNRMYYELYIAENDDDDNNKFKGYKLMYGGFGCPTIEQAVREHGDCHA